MIDDIIDLRIKHIVGITRLKDKRPEIKCWESKISFNYNTISLGYFIDPFSAGLVYTLVRKLISPNIDLNNMFIHTNRKTGKYQITKKINKEWVYFTSFDSLEKARYERDLLVKYNWDWEKVCECHDETVDNNIIFNNRLVGIGCVD